MRRIIQVTGLMDSFRGRESALEQYEQKLYEIQEQEAEILIDIGVLYLDNDEFDDALKNFQEALENYKKIGYNEGEAFTHDLIGDTYLTVRNTQKALYHYQKALDKYNMEKSALADDMAVKIEELLKIEEALTISAKKEGTSKNKSSFKAKKSSKESITSSTATKRDYAEIEDFPEKTVEMKLIADKLEESIMLMDNAKLYLDYYKESKTTAYLEEALNTAKLIEDYDGQGTIHLMMGDINLKKENTDEALNQFEKAYTIFKKQGNQKGEATTLLLFGAVYFILDRKEDMYHVFKDSITIFKKSGFKKGESVAKNLIEMLSSD